MSTVYRHVGDLGNVDVSADGTVVAMVTDSQVSLFGADSVVGRSVVVGLISQLSLYHLQHSPSHSSGTLACPAMDL